MKTLCISIIVLFILISCTSTQTIPPETDVQYWNNFRSEWIDLDQGSYRSYARNNTQKFADAPGAIWQEGLEKWRAYYKYEKFPASKIIDERMAKSDRSRQRHVIPIFIPFGVFWP